MTHAARKCSPEAAATCGTKYVASWLRSTAGRLGSYAAAARELRLSAAHVRAWSANDRAEGSHVSVRSRERKMQGFQKPGSTQRLLSLHAAVANTFATSRHLVSVASHRLLRTEDSATWRDAVVQAA